MQIVIKGVASVYEPENIARMFFPGARLEKACLLYTSPSPRD